MKIHHCEFNMRSLMLCACLSFLVGCGAGDSGPPLYPATGVVTYKGDPLPNASIILTPQTNGPIATAKTDAEGKFELVTAGKPGAIAATFGVGITAIEAGPTSTLTPEQMQAQYEKDGKMPNVTAKSLIPDRYSSPRTSKLTAEIKVDNPNELKFELTE